MSDMTNYLEEQLLNAALNGGSYTGVATTYIALFTSDPTETGAGTEVDSTGYTRQSINFTAPLDSIVSNSNLVEYEPATSSIGAVSHIAVMDAQTGGNALFYKALDTPIDISAGVGLRIQPGNLSISLN